MNNVQFNFKKAFFNRRLGVAEHREFQILEKALEMIAQKGFENLQFGDLAKRCKISRTLVHHYFKDKFELANKLLDLSTLHLQFYVAEALSQEKDPKQHLKTYCAATLDWPALYPKEAASLLLFVHLCTHNAEMRARNDELSTLGRQKIKLFLTQAESSTSRLDSNALIIQTLLTGCCLSLLTENHSAKESLTLRSHCLKECLRIAS
ncbi:MAG: TetR/AcrR family transcriptional regulator [Bdellovibrio sp.]